MSAAARKTGRRARTIGPVRLVRAGPERAPADDRERLVEAADPAAELVDEAGDADAAGPVEQDGRGIPADAVSRAGASRTNAASRPTKRALFFVAGMTGILGVRRRHGSRRATVDGGRNIMAVPTRGRLAVVIRTSDRREPTRAWRSGAVRHPPPVTRRLARSAPHLEVGHS